MSKNILAGYFTNVSDDLTSSTTGSVDIGGRTFFDVISECKDFNERETSNDLEKDSKYDSWPLPQNLKNLLNTPVQFDKEFVFAFQDPLIDPIKQIVTKYYGEQEAAKRQLPNYESVIADVNGLQILIKCGCTRSAINLTTKILKENRNRNTMFTPYSMQIWFVRIACLMKLKLFKEAETELKQFENFDKPQFFYEFHNEAYPNRKGSMIPFGFRVLNAELAQHLNKSEESIGNLYRLLSNIQDIVDSYKEDESALKIWSERKLKVLFSIINVLIARKNYDKAIDTMNQVLNISYIDKCAIWSLIGKLFVQIGNLKDASDSFMKAKSFSQPDSKENKSRILINMSLLRIANGLYKEAYEVLSEADTLVPNNPITVNNMSFCLFYSGNLKAAIQLIEQFIINNPNKNVNESLIFNLCTLYELESAKAHQKKLKLLLWLNIYAGDGFYEQCLQL